MGHYSAVAVTMTAHDYTDIYNEVMSFPSIDERRILFYYSSEEIKNEVEDVVVLIWERVEWHDSRKGVRYFMDKFRSIPCIFQRLGEDAGDYKRVEYNFDDEDIGYLWDYEPYVSQEFCIRPWTQPYLEEE